MVDLSLGINAGKMNTYIVLLRGVNVSGVKKIRMAALRMALENTGFRDVSTYIQSGNIVLRYKGSREMVIAKVMACIQDEFGHEVPVLVYTPEEWGQIYAGCPYPAPEALQKNIYVVYLFESPPETRIRALEQESFPNEEFRFGPNRIYLSCQKVYGKAKCNTNFFEKRLQVSGTTRNLRTVETLLRMAAELD